MVFATAAEARAELGKRDAFVERMSPFDRSSRLKTDKPGAWEVYDLAADRSEKHDLAATRGDLIDQAKEVLRREVAPNSVFPLEIPGVTDTASP